MITIKRTSVRQHKVSSSGCTVLPDPAAKGGCRSVDRATVVTVVAKGGGKGGARFSTCRRDCRSVGRAIVVRNVEQEAILEIANDTTLGRTCIVGSTAASASHMLTHGITLNK